MPETPEPATPSAAEMQARLHELARLLRHSNSIDAESQRSLAALVDELGNALEGVQVPGTEVALLAESTAHLAESLHRQQDLGFLGRARERLESAIGNAETQAPLAVGLARRWLDALANLGI